MMKLKRECNSAPLAQDRQVNKALKPLGWRIEENPTVHFVSTPAEFTGPFVIITGTLRAEVTDLNNGRRPQLTKKRAFLLVPGKYSVWVPTVERDWKVDDKKKRELEKKRQEGEVRP